MTRVPSKERVTPQQIRASIAALGWNRRVRGPRQPKAEEAVEAAPDPEPPQRQPVAVVPPEAVPVAHAWPLTGAEVARAAGVPVGTDQTRRARLPT